MSQTVSTVPDPYIAQQIAPPQTLTLDPKYGNVRMVTPVGRFTYATLVTPKAGQDNPNQLKFSLTLLLNPATCGDIYNAICMVAERRFQPEDKPDPTMPRLANGEMQLRRYSVKELLMLPRDKGGLHYPLRNGDDIYMKDAAKYGVFRGMFSINASIAEKNRHGQSQQPVCFDESGTPINPDRMYSGAYGRMMITVFAFPQPGQQMPNRGIGVMLNSVQFARHGEKLASFDAVKAGQSAFAAAGALPVDNSMQQMPAGAAYNPQPGFGPNAATTASIPPGFAAPGQPIAPQAQPQMQQAGALPPGQNVQQQPMQQYAPQQQAWQPPAG